MHTPSPSHPYAAGSTSLPGTTDTAHRTVERLVAESRARSASGRTPLSPDAAITAIKAGLVLPTHQGIAALSAA